MSLIFHNFPRNDFVFLAIILELGPAANITGARRLFFLSHDIEKSAVRFQIKCLRRGRNVIILKLNCAAFEKMLLRIDPAAAVAHSFRGIFH